MKVAFSFIFWTLLVLSVALHWHEMVTVFIYTGLDNVTQVSFKCTALSACAESDSPIYCIYINVLAFPHTFYVPAEKLNHDPDEQNCTFPKASRPHYFQKQICRTLVILHFIFILGSSLVWQNLCHTAYVSLSMFIPWLHCDITWKCLPSWTICLVLWTPVCSPGVKS